LKAFVDALIRLGEQNWIVNEKNEGGLPTRMSTDFLVSLLASLLVVKIILSTPCLLPFVIASS
jgi:hypothetical protein